MLRYLWLIVAIAMPTITLAGQKEVNAAKAICYLIIIHEKCTGESMPTAKLERIVRALQSNGMSFQDFKSGSQKALAQAQELYPRDTRPPQSTCNAAEDLYRQNLGPM